VAVGAAFKKVSGLARLLTGEAVSIEHTQGVPMLINFWAAWCQPSIKYTREIAKMVSEEKKIRFVSISVDSEIGKA
jgi:thioredoxin-like negative regulator of GroEL